MSVTSPVARRWFKRDVVAMSVLAVGLIVGALVIAAPLAVLQSAVVTEIEDSIQRGIDASSARYTALAAHYAAENTAILRGIDASAARCTALGEHFAEKDAGVQRGIDASAARYTALAAYYAALAPAETRADFD